MYRKAMHDRYAASISNYAQQDEREFFSELFAAKFLDKRVKPAYIIKGLEAILR